jgi:hypothetical protein
VEVDVAKHVCNALKVLDEETPLAFQMRWSPAADVARAADVEGPWTRAGYRSTRLVDADKMEAAPPVGDRRRGAGDEQLRAWRRHDVKRGKRGRDGDGEDVQGVYGVTR